MLHEERLSRTPLAEYANGERRVGTSGANEQREGFDCTLDADEVLLGVHVGAE